MWGEKLIALKNDHVSKLVLIVNEFASKWYLLKT